MVDLRNDEERGVDAAARPAGIVLLLALAGVPADDIASDYELSTTQLPALFASLGLDDQGPVLADVPRPQGHARATLLAMLSGLDVEGRLRAAGLLAEDLVAVPDAFLAFRCPVASSGRRHASSASG